MVLDIVNFWNKKYINMVAPTIKVFKLDKVETRIDDLYGEENSSRIYLSPIEMKGFHLDTSWAQILGPFALTEQEENTVFVVNFENMVQKIRARKEEHVTDMYIAYSGSGTPKASKSGNYFYLKVGNNLVTSFNLTNIYRNTTKKLGESINALDNFSVELYGKNDSSINIVDFEETEFYGAALQVYSEEDIYDNVSDVIEAGDAILTNKWRLYEVMNINPSGDFAWEWVTYMISCRLARLDQMSLPGDYKREIEEHQYGIKQRYEVE
jgi:hypothetical protein